MSHLEFLAELEAAGQADPILPGLPAATYLSGALGGDQLEKMAVVWHQRTRYNKEYGFCLFTAEVVQVLTGILTGKRVLEAGSGSGWLAAQLVERGIDVTAADWTDYRAPRDDGHGYPISAVYRLDHHGDAAALLPGDFDAVLMVWPNLDTPFGEDVAQAMTAGQILILEGEGKGGCTARDEFFDALDAEFESLKPETAALNESHLTFPGLHDHWTVWKKK